jgi:hypothetical protein
MKAGIRGDQRVRAQGHAADADDGFGMAADQLEQQAAAEVGALGIQGGLLAVHVEVRGLARGEGEGALAVGFSQEQVAQSLSFVHGGSLQ